MANEDEILLYFWCSVDLLAAIQCFGNTKDFFFLSVTTSFLIAQDAENEHCFLTKTAKHVLSEKKVSIVPSVGNN